MTWEDCIIQYMLYWPIHDTFMMLLRQFLKFETSGSIHCRCIEKNNPYNSLQFLLLCPMEERKSYRFITKGWFVVLFINFFMRPCLQPFNPHTHYGLRTRFTRICFTSVFPETKYTCKTGYTFSLWKWPISTPLADNRNQIIPSFLFYFL